jgi:cyclopropane fatty-acyl-phospholipid synthase-like methyltransferase
MKQTRAPFTPQVSVSGSSSASSCAHTARSPSRTAARAQWEDAAGAWHSWGPTLEDWLGEATTLMLDAADVATGSAVLDVAAAAGGQTLAAARRAGADGHVLATDISPAILAYTAATATAAGLTNVRTGSWTGSGSTSRRPRSTP